MARGKGERAIKREEKHALKEKQKRIEEANKMLIPVPKATKESLGLISFDPSGTFRFMNNRWVKVFRLNERIGENREIKLSTLAGDFTSDIRITTEVAAGILTSVSESSFMTLIRKGEIYEEVRAEFQKDEELLKGLFNMKALTVDEIFNLISRKEKDNIFSYASMVRGKKNWLKELPEIMEQSDHFLWNESYGECCFALQFPFDNCIDVTEKLMELGCPIIESLELNGINNKENMDFKRSLEKRYNRKYGNEANVDLINISYQLLFTCDSQDARKIIEKTIISMHSKEQFILSPSIGMQKEAAMNILSLGLLEHKNMRNISANVVDQLKM